MRSSFTRKLALFFIALWFINHQAVGAPQPQPEIVIDAETGKVLHQIEATRSWYPASLTKMMTLYLVFTALKGGELKLEEELSVSQQAAAQPANTVGLRSGEKIAVKKAILATATVSANDASVALAERVAGTEAAFVVLMNEQAIKLGMDATRFTNATGLPNPDQQTSARDMAILGLRLLHDYPQWFHFFSAPSLSHHGKTHLSTNRKFLNYPGAEGIKTGFTCDSGYNLVASIKRDDRQLIGVVLGAKNGTERYTRMLQLLERGFAADGTVRPEDFIGYLKNALPEKPFSMDSTVCVGRIAKGRGIIEREGNLPGWGILLGVYKTRDKALSKARQTRSRINKVLKKSRVVIAILPRRFKHGTSWKTLLVGMTSEEAGQACWRLWANKLPCSSMSPAMLNQPGFAKR
jgi:D-alanyl-D-alanine carboxypeptidase